MAQARQPSFYTDFLVPDTIDGRFDLIVMHAVLFFRRMRGEGAKIAEFTQEVFDLFFQDMDASLREMGVSDTCDEGKKSSAKVADASPAHSEVSADTLV